MATTTSAYKAKVEDLVRGEYVRSLESSEPSYLKTSWGQHISRARVMGTVVEKFLRDDQSYGTLRVDDGTETISIRSWREGVPELMKFNLGDRVDVIGKIREYNGEIYLTPELILKVSDPNWELVRELETLSEKKKLLAAGKRPVKKPEFPVRELEVGQPQPSGEKIEIVEELPPQVPDEVKKKALLVFEKLEKKGGTSIDDLAAELNISKTEAEDIIRDLITDGDIFEPTSGRFRKVSL